MTVLWESFVGGTHSLGVVGEECILALDSLGIDVCPRPWNLSALLRRIMYPHYPTLTAEEARRDAVLWGATALEGMRPRTAELVQSATRGIGLDEERTALAMMWGPIGRISSPGWRHTGAYAAYTYYDFRMLNRSMKASCNVPDLLFVPSTFVRDSMLSSGVRTPVHVWHHGVDTATFTPVDHTTDRFTFLFVGVAQERKGMGELLQAFHEAFPDSVRDVRLVVKTADWGDPAAWQKDYGTDPRILWTWENVNRAQLAQMMAQADCMVIPSRAESFCLPLLEGLSCGLPVVFTDHGGQRDFCDGEVGYPVAVKRLEPRIGPVQRQLDGYTSAPVWAIPDTDQLVDVLRWVYSHPGEARAKGSAGRRRAKAWTWTAVTEQVLPILRSLT